MPTPDLRNSLLTVFPEDVAVGSVGGDAWRPSGMSDAILRLREIERQEQADYYRHKISDRLVHKAYLLTVRGELSDGEWLALALSGIAAATTTDGTTDTHTIGGGQIGARHGAYARIEGESTDEHWRLGGMAMTNLSFGVAGRSAVDFLAEYSVLSATSTTVADAVAAAGDITHAVDTKTGCELALGFGGGAVEPVAVNPTRSLAIAFQRDADPVNFTSAGIPERHAFDGSTELVGKCDTVLPAARVAEGIGSTLTATMRLTFLGGNLVITVPSVILKLTRRELIGDDWARVGLTFQALSTTARSVATVAHIRN